VTNVSSSSCNSSSHSRIMRLVLKARLLHPFQQALLLLFSALLQHPRPRCQLMLPQLLPPPPCQLMCRWQQALLLELVPATKML
jgi:hypothetical protein